MAISSKVAPNGELTMIKTRLIPSGATEVKSDVGTAVVYIWEEYNKHKEKMMYLAMAYQGKRKKHDFYLNFRSVESRERYYKSWMTQIDKRDADRAKQKGANKLHKHPYKVGDILCGSWGYNQTNVSWYQVIKTTKKTITLRELRGKTVQHLEGGFAARVVPIKDAFASEREIRKTPKCYVQPSGEVSWSVRMESYLSISLWDNHPRHESYTH